jgi:hypothetical protein
MKDFEKIYSHTQIMFSIQPLEKQRLAQIK